MYLVTFITPAINVTKLMYNAYMSIVLDILEELWNAKLNYKGVRVNFFGVPRFKYYKQSSVKSTFYRLRDNKLISKNEGGWCITKDGKEYLSEGILLKTFLSKFKKDAPKNLLLMFDVPVDRRRNRDWLRRQLKLYGYQMIQQSVWVGPSPLPAEFVEHTRIIKIDKNIRTFKLAKPYAFKSGQ